MCRVFLTHAGRGKRPCSEKPGSFRRLEPAPDSVRVLPDGETSPPVAPVEVRHAEVDALAPLLPAASLAAAPFHAPPGQEEEHRCLHLPVNERLPPAGSGGEHDVPTSPFVSLRTAANLCSSVSATPRGGSGRGYSSDPPVLAGSPLFFFPLP